MNPLAASRPRSVPSRSRRCAAPTAGETPATHCVGIVTGVDAAQFTVSSGAMVSRARRALSCLLEPALGDSVACVIVAPQEVWILGVLQREEGTPHVLRCEPGTRIDAGSGTLTVCSDALRLEQRRFELSADQAEVIVDEALVSGREHRWIGGVLQIIGSALNSTLDRVTHFSRQYLRTTEGIDRVQATYVEQQAAKVMRLGAENTLISGEKLVKARGGQIHFG
jgi:hypothetical protein